MHHCSVAVPGLWAGPPAPCSLRAPASANCVPLGVKATATPLPAVPAPCCCWRSSNYSGRWAWKGQRGDVDFPETLQLRVHLLASPQLATRESRKVSKQSNSAVVSPSPLSPSRETLCARSPGVSWCRFWAGGCGGMADSSLQAEQGGACVACTVPCRCPYLYLGLVFLKH